MTSSVGREVNMLDEVEGCKQVMKGLSQGSQWLIKMKIEVASDDQFSRRSGKTFKQIREFRKEDRCRGGGWTIYSKNIER